MTKNEQNRVVAWRLKILRQANDLPRGVAQTCRTTNTMAQGRFLRPSTCPASASSLQRYEYEITKPISGCGNSMRNPAADYFCSFSKSLR